VVAEKPRFAEYKVFLEAPEEMVSTLAEMGFTPEQAKKALRETDFNM